MTEVGSLQQLTTRLTGTNRELVAEATTSQRRLDEQFLIGAILAGLAALVAWAAKKFVFAEGGRYWEGPGSQTPRYTTKTINDNLQVLSGASEVAYGPSGNLSQRNSKQLKDGLNAIGNAKKNAIVALQDGTKALASALQTLNSVVPKSGTNVDLLENVETSSISAAPGQVPSNRGTQAVVSGKDVSPAMQNVLRGTNVSSHSPLGRASGAPTAQAELLKTSIENLRGALKKLNDELPNLISALNSWKVGGVA